MPNKILFCATVDYHISSFHMPVLQWFKQRGWEIHIAAKGERELPYADRKFNIPFERSPFRWRNREAYRQVKRLIEHHGYQIVHCHTPVGGVLARLASRRARRQGTQVMYTAHGFHFCRGAPLINWMLYYPVEKLLARSTDCLITINQEDYRLAVRRRFKAARIEHVHGVGVSGERFYPALPEYKASLRELMSFDRNDILLFYAAEFNRNKNHQLLIHALARIRERAPQVRLLLAGEGALLEACKSVSVKLGVDRHVHFLGYRNDIPDLLHMSDIAVSGSLREGLPVQMMEAMACGLPIIATRNRGHLELVCDGRNGYIVPPQAAGLFAERIATLADSPDLRESMGRESLQMFRKYEQKAVLHELGLIYESHMHTEGEGGSCQVL
ncbi:glycosyltransferase family 4 protein [Paenibacillus melissococcoides]|uniref:Glycosyltransferase family 4 protein n=1 Tax=Paenibacillus melissococcoides TaxID=2912268 RepID=A0ABM9FZS6_9BACL|nr:MULTISPECIES: glycosyltransferase family 4 protein [Paenibacillus]MEB9893201.1 glycosyltransferase family 4 protein [Bacillus cereus]CAH8244793.1 glycosyltransferase family 4 protein [Paenibacillus melissococcoides]CAH8708991.1 glycosyltransferase family 4 protein [Paenibacillus melissococcoides]CAH8709746.1 glycosyltransferase family 4 protein [Paenibacillus melissococcoides]GIO82374.1 putative glycosyltransferase EpsD [Paenibacillus dendritiformis]